MLRLATAMAGSAALWGCAGPLPLDALRAREPVARAEVAADYKVVAACLTDRYLRHGFQVVPNIREHERRATVTASILIGARRRRVGLSEAEVVATGGAASRAALRTDLPFVGPDASDVAFYRARSRSARGGRRAAA